jgi:hypothetical protein
MEKVNNVRISPMISILEVMPIASSRVESHMSFDSLFFSFSFLLPCSDNGCLQTPQFGQASQPTDGSVSRVAYGLGQIVKHL